MVLLVHRRLPNRCRRAIAGIAAAGSVGASLAGAVAGPAVADVRPICFPVVDPVTYRDDFGEPRSGRTHEGNDLMGQKMHRLISAVDGTIFDLRWEAGTGHSDHGLRIRGDDGYYYAYLHMNDDTPGTDDGLATREQIFAPGIVVNARVRAGQLLGYMGDSGNAESAGPHLHFEIRTQLWSGPINPYDSLQAARRCAPVNSPTHPFTPLGGTVVSDPDAASMGSGSLDSFVRGADNALWHRAWVPGGTDFSLWLSLGGISRSGPAAVSPGPERVDVFIRGVDDALWQRTRIAGEWGDWTSLGGIVLSDPDAASTRNGDIAVSIRGADGAIWVRQFDGAVWGEWTSAGGGLRSGPGIGASAAGRLDIFARGLDDALWHRASVDGTWAPWETMGGIIDVDPDVAVEDGGLHVIVRGTDRRLYALPYSAGGAWTPVSVDPVAGGAGIASWGPGRLDVFVAGTDNALYQTWWDGAGW